MASATDESLEEVTDFLFISFVKPEMCNLYFVLFTGGCGGVGDNLIVRLIKRCYFAVSMLLICLMMFSSYQVKVKTIQQRRIQHHQIESFQK